MKWLKKVEREIEQFNRDFPDCKKSERVKFIKELCNKYSDVNVSELCRKFDISRAYFYKKEVQKKETISDDRIYECVKELRKRDKWMGYKKILVALNTEYKERLDGFKISRYRLCRILDEHDDFVKR